MFWIKVKRIVRAGFFSFWRNGFVSLSSILVMMVTLFVIGSVILSSVVFRYTLDKLEEKVSINVYFITSAKEEDIIAIKKSLEQLPEVRTPVQYISREEALENFKKKHENDEYTIQALDELGENPLGAALNIKAKDPSQYQEVVRYLNTMSAVTIGQSSIIDKVNYSDNVNVRNAIDRLTNIIRSANKMGLFLTLLLVTISILITFNTLRLVIYMSRDEISVMKLVGASNRHIKGPFFVAGSIYGFLSAIITLLIFYLLTYWLGKNATEFLDGLNMFNYYISNFGEIFLIIVGSGVAIGALSSYLAVRKYLRV